MGRGGGGKRTQPNKELKIPLFLHGELVVTLSYGLVASPSSLTLSAAPCTCDVCRF